MKILILKTDFFRKKNMNTIFVGSSYDIYVLAGFCDQIPLSKNLSNLRGKNITKVWGSTKKCCDWDLNPGLQLSRLSIYQLRVEKFSGNL